MSLPKTMLTSDVIILDIQPLRYEHNIGQCGQCYKESKFVCAGCKQPIYTGEQIACEFNVHCHPKCMEPYKRYIMELNVKRFHFDGKLEDKCPLCDELWILDGKEDYIAYPNINEEAIYTAYCDHCENEWEVKYILTVSINKIK